MKRLMIAMSILTFCVTSEAAPPIDPIEVGKPFPALVLPTLEGQPRSMADFRGQKILLHVFASW